MTTNNCLYCEKVNENMKGKLVIEVKVPDGMLIYDYVYVSQSGGPFEVKLGAGSTFIYNIREAMNIYAHMDSEKCGKTECVKVTPNEFYHFIIDYDYYYFQNQPRVKGVRWQRVSHWGTIQTRFGNTNFRYNFVKILGNMFNIPCVFSSFYHKICYFKNSMNLKVLKTEVFQGGSFR